MAPRWSKTGQTATCRTVGVDETTFAHAAPTRRAEYVTGVVDTDRALLVDVVRGRFAAVLAAWLSDQPAAWLAAVGVASLDAFRGYADALSQALPEATMVIDHFHVITLANTAVDGVRRRVNQDLLGHRGRRSDPL